MKKKIIIHSKDKKCPKIIKNILPKGYDGILKITVENF